MWRPLRLVPSRLGRHCCHSLAKPTPKSTIRELRQMIEKSGLTHSDCYEKKDLLRRAEESYNLLQQVQKEPWPHNLAQDVVISRTRNWLDRMIVGLSFCPFAKRSLPTLIIEVVPTAAEGKDMVAEYRQIVINSSVQVAKVKDSEISSKLLVFTDPRLADFEDFREFSGKFEILGETLLCIPFHPKAVKQNTLEESPNNYTHRSPWPTLHIIRESQFKNVYPEPGVEPSQVEKTNKETTAAMGNEKLQAMLEQFQRE